MYILSSTLHVFLSMVCISQLLIPTLLDKSSVIYYNTSIVGAPGTIFVRTLNIPLSVRVDVKYNISFPKDRCCPYIGLGFLAATVSRMHNDTCTDITLKYSAQFNRYLIYTKPEFPFSECQLVPSGYDCNGTRNLISAFPRTWDLSAFYPCWWKQGLNLTVSLKMKYFTQISHHCESLSAKICKKDFNYSLTSFPNVLGHTTQIEANQALGLAIRYNSIFHCYQHTMLLICHVLFPKCHNGTVMYPCYEMCSEADAGCRTVLAQFNQQILTCDALPRANDSMDCIYEPVRCPPLQPPECGVLNSTGRLLFDITKYYCDTGYELYGDHAIRHCTYSGTWNGTAPSCKALSSPPNVHDLIIAVLLPISVIVILTIAITCICTRRKSSSSRKGTGTTNGQRKKLFITYSSIDMDFVNQEFLPELRQRLPAWDTVTYQEDFLPGSSVIKSMHDGIWNNDAMLVLLTDNYIASGMCQHEFTEAETRSVIDKSFRLIVILIVNTSHGGTVQLPEDIPEGLRTFIRSRVYLPWGNSQFWYKLTRSLVIK